MEILLRDRQTRLYYSNLQQWTGDPAQAHNFKQSSHAIQYACSRSLADAEVVYYFGDGRESISLPILNPRPGRVGLPAGKV